MGAAMHCHSPALLLYAGEPVTRFEIIVFLIVAGAGLVVAVCWGMVEDWIQHTRGRKWPTISAVVDAVSVTVVDSKLPSSAAVHFWPSYLATLTFSYRNPEQQVGEYKRNFGSGEDAKAWANSYKGETVRVRVDPRDPARSVLRDEDL